MKNMQPFEIVVIDHDIAARRHLSQLLSESHAHAQVSESDGGNQAIATVLRNKPDIVFLDVALEHPDSLEVLKEIWKHYQPYIVLTGWNSWAIAQCRNVFFLSKPYEAIDVALALQMRSTLANGRKKQPVDELLAASLHKPVEDLWLDGIKTVLASNEISEELLSVNEITHFKREGKVIALHTPDRRLWVNESIDALEYQLDRSVMIRTGRNEIINITFLENLVYDQSDDEYHVLLQTGEKVKWEKGYREHIKRSLARVG